MENVPKKQTLEMAADTLSTHHLVNNQLLLWVGELRVSVARGPAHARLSQHGTRAGDRRQPACEIFENRRRVTVSVHCVYVQLRSTYLRPETLRLFPGRLIQFAPADGLGTQLDKFGISAHPGWARRECGLVPGKIHRQKRNCMGRRQPTRFQQISRRDR